jgi:hypothetical protein
MASMRTQLLLAAATFLTGILAGGVVDGVIVGGPAWHELGAQAWAHYSHLADLGAGLVAYPIEGIGATLLTLAAAVSHYVEGRRARDPTTALYSASTLSVAGLLLTTRAAPVMLGLASLQTEDAVRRAFGQFFLWGLYLRGTADVLAFIALIWALSTCIGLKGTVRRRLTPNTPHTEKHDEPPVQPSGTSVGDRRGHHRDEPARCASR